MMQCGQKFWTKDIMIPAWPSGIKHELQTMIILVTLPEVMTFCFLQSYQKPAVSEMIMIPGYY